MGISVLTARRSRAAGAVAGALVVVPGVLTALALTPASASAPAAVTPVSTVYKTGTDPTTGSTASSPGTPGDPAGSTGVTQPGDTVNWAVSYQNNTGTNASVNITDPLTAAGAYVPGSLQLPPNPDGAQPFAAQYSTDDGATWQPGTPPAGATGVGLTGTFPPTTQQQSVNPAAPRSINLTNSAGDGYNAVTSADGSLVYAVFHHNNTNTAVFCASSSGGLCPGWPAGSNTTATFVSPIAGTPIGTGTNGGLTTGIQNGTFLAGGNLYWVAQQITAVSGRYPVGVMCLNLTTLQSCGFTQLDSVLAGPAGGTSGQISGTGIAASDGQYYYLDSDGNLLCFSPSAGACGVIATVSPTAGSMPASYTYGNIILGQIQRAGASTYSLTCYNVTTGSSCPGYPISPTAPPSPAPYASGHVAPVLNSAGTLIGACVMNNAASYGCWSLTGAPVNNPYPATGAGSTTNETGDALALGTRVYLPVSSDNAVGCYDFAGYTETGKVPACTGFTPAANPSNYTVRPMTGNTACLLADGDGKKISSFDAFTGGPCSSTTATETVSPVDYYCGSGTAGFLAWNQLAITGAPAGSYTEAEVSLTGADGNPVAGFTGVVLAPGKTLNLSSIPVTAPTSQLTAQVTLHSATAAVTAAQVSLSWAGDVPQMCFQTTAPPVPCGQSAAVTNNATAVTTGAGGSDAPKGDSSGNATFTSAPAADACSLDIIKTASPAEARPGGTVTYTVTVRNTGTAAYAASDPAQFSDDLTGVLADAAYNNDASASTGTVSYTAPALSWSGDLAAGASATVTYSVTVDNPDTGPHTLVNTVVSSSPASSNCAAGSPGPACTATVPVADLTIRKTATPASVSTAGQVIGYSFAVTNTGQAPLDPVTVNDIQEPPAGPLSSGPACPQAPLAPGDTETCTAAYTVTQADVDNGSVNDSATATGSPPSGPAVTSPPSAASVPAVQGPAVTVAKSTTTATVTAAGQQVPYTFLVTNTGNVTLTGVTVTDTVTPPSDPANLSPVTCPGTTLVPGASVTCTATYTVTQADIDSGSVDDSATVTGTPPATPGNPNPVPLPPSPPSGASVPVAQAPALSVAKSAAPPQVHAPGDVISYQFLVTNTGNVTLAGVTVTDTQASPAGSLDGPVTCPDTTLAPGASTACTATYTVTQADIDNGSVDDSATASGAPPSGPAVTSPPSAASVPAAQAPALTVVKATATATVTRAGQQVPYSFLVTNTGNVTVHDVTVSDAVAAPSDPAGLSPVTCPDTTLAPGASVTCTATYTVTQADVDGGGSVDDSAAASGTPPSGPAVTSPPSTGSVPVAQSPAVTVAKSAVPAQVHAAGDVISYTFVVTNTGNVTLTSVAVTDAQAAPAGALDGPVSCPDTTLAPGASTSCTATYTVTQADIDSGSVDDAATASGTPPSGPAVTSPPSVVSVPVAQAPAIAVDKSAAPAQVHAAGDVISYTFVVTNTGNVTLHNVTVTDAQAAPAGALDAPVTCRGTTLAPGASTSCTATYTVTQADVDSGSVDDSATAAGTPPSGPAVTSAPSAASVPAVPAPDITVAKSTTTASVTRAGQQVPYTFTVTNTGNVTLHGVTVADTVAPPSDPAALSPVTCPDTTLAPGASTSCKATYTVSQADVDSGSVDDSATAAGTPPSGPAVTSAPSAASVPAVPAPDITVAKSTTTATVTHAGQQVPYMFVVTNAGNVTLTGVAVTDTVAPPSEQAGLSPVTCPDTTLAPGASVSCAATYTVTQADVDEGGPLRDSATATGTPPATPGNPSPVPLPPSLPSDESVPVTQVPVITVAKSTSTTTVTGAGQQVPYTFLVTNAGNVTLSGVTVTDRVAPPSEQAGLSPVTCPDTTLAPGASTSCTATYTVTQADVDGGGPLRDSATVTGTPPATSREPAPVPLPPSPPSGDSVPVAQSPALSVVKSAPSAQVHAAGDEIGYEFLVTNTGNVTLTSVAVTDTVAAPSDPANLSPVTCPDTTLAPGTSTTCTATYTLTVADVDNGSVNDTAAASGAPPSGPALTSAPSAASVPLPSGPAVTIVKSATPAQVHAAGELVTYRFTVTDTGNDTLHDVTVTDTQAPPAGSLDGPVTCPDTTLAPGASTTCTATYTVTQADIDHGQVNDTATATGTPPSGPPVTSPPVSVSALAAQAPAITVDKSAPAATVTHASQQLSYTFLVTNAGNVTLHDVTVTDVAEPPSNPAGLSPVTCPDSTLAPGASETCAATYTVTQADVDHGGPLSDSATVTGTPPPAPGNPSPPPLQGSPPSRASLPVAQAPRVSVVKSTAAAEVTQAGQQVRYSFLVTDTGNVTLHDVTVTDVVAPPSDPKDLSPLTCPRPALAPAESETCTATYTVTQADVDHGGPLRDSATATGTPPATAADPHPAPLPPSPPSGTSVRVAQAPALSVLKSAAPAQVHAPGDVIRYQFAVTNAGNVTLFRVSVPDPELAAASITVGCPASRLAPGASETCTPSRPYTVTGADIARGTVANTATATAVTPSGAVTRSRPSSVTVRVTPGGIVIPTGQGGNAPPAASPALAAAAGAALLAAGALLLMLVLRRRGCRHGT